MKVKLTYFQENGKFYTEGEIDMELDYLFIIWDKLEKMFKEGKRPGLTDGHSGLHVLVTTEFHPEDIPHLFLNIA